MTDLELLIDLHLDAERQGPGSMQHTSLALTLSRLPIQRPLRIADIGCGTGAQTMVLADRTSGELVAIDQSAQFLERLMQHATRFGFEERIRTEACSMEDLSLPEGYFDLIWSEGAIYNMGFEAGIRAWQRFLRPGGVLAVSEISWLGTERPAEIEDFWHAEYPEIDTVANKISQIEQNGYLPLAHFLLPDYCWTQNYYEPLHKRLPDFLQRHANTDAAQRIAQLEKQEYELYRRYGQYYTYGFYLAQKL